MQKHHRLLVAGLVLAALVAIVIPAAAATTNRADVIGEANGVIATLRTLTADQGDIADRIEKLKVQGGSVSEQASLAADTRELRAKLENAQASVADLIDKINGLRLISAADQSIDENDMLQITCKVSNVKPKVGDTVTYEAVTTAGSSKGSTYSWSGDFAGVSQQERFYFTGSGIFNASVSAKNQKGETASAACPTVVVSPNSAATAATSRASGAAVTIIGPTDNSSLAIGSQATFSWKHRGLASGERLNISLRGQGGQYFVKTSVPQGDNGVGSYIWASVGTTPNSYVPAGSYTLQICTDDGVICGVSSINLASR